jgi:hypothetical protein
LPWIALPEERASDDALPERFEKIAFGEDPPLCNAIASERPTGPAPMIETESTGYFNNRSCFTNELPDD